MRRFVLLVMLGGGLVACDPVVDKHTPDGHVNADAGPDAAPDHGMVTVKIYDVNNTGAVVVGVPVVFIEADGTVVGHPATDSNGVASADVHKNASATVVITTQGTTQMQTLTGLQPNDNIVLGPNTPMQTTDGTFTVSYPSFGANVSTYRVYGPCGQSSASGTVFSQVLTMYSDCMESTMDLQVIAFDANGLAIGYIDKPDVAYTAGGSTAITGNYQGLQGFSAMYTNIDPSITTLNMTRTLPDSYGYGAGGGGTPANGMLTVAQPVPQGTSATVLTRAFKGRFTNIVMQKIQGNALSYGMDVGATLLPFLGQPTFDVTSMKLTTPVDTVGTTTDAPDLFWADVSYSRTVNGTATSYAWIIFGPAPADLTLPQLPAEVGDVLPQPTDTINNTFSGMIEADTLSGYDAVRPDVYGIVFGLLDAAHPTAMRMRESAYGQGG